MGNPLLSLLRIFTMFAATVAMIVLIRVVGEAFERHIWVFLFLMFAGQAVVLIFVVLGQNAISGPNTSPLDKNLIKNPIIWCMAALITTNAAGVFASSGFVSGPATTILNCTPLITILIFDRFLVGAKVTIWHVLSIFIIIGGLCVGLNDLKEMANTSVVAAIVLVLSLSFTPLIGILKDIWFRPRPSWHPLAGEMPSILPNVLLYLSLQIPFHILYLPFYGIVKMPAFKDMGHNIKTGLECVFTGKHGYPAADGSLTENCEIMLWLWILLAVTTVVQIGSSFYVARYESGAYSIVVQSACPFVADAIFGWHALMGDKYTEAAGNSTWISLGIIAVGTIGFHFSEMLVDRGGEEETMKTASKFKKWVLRQGMQAKLFSDNPESKALLN
eukprot:m.334641 g.334641  ORF g.334641 m.334641 type:complete len:388 (-) comp17403_c0_seq1:962-2125(-)